MEGFARARELDHAERRIALSGGSPGVAASLDIDLFQKRRASMLALLRTGAGAASYASWLPVSEALARARSEKLEGYLKLLYVCFAMSRSFGKVERRSAISICAMN